VNTQVKQLRITLVSSAWLVASAIGSWAIATEPALFETDATPLLQPVNWQQPAGEPLLQPEVVIPVLPIQPPVVQEVRPFLDGNVMEEEITPPTTTDDAEPNQRGVRPYGGGHPKDWDWGCGGSPYRTGPGVCDNWDVGCRWDVTVDGIVMSREQTDLPALASRINLDSTGAVINDPLTPLDLTDDPMLEEFDYGPGGRASFISKLPKSEWQMHFGYEGIEEWNASVVYPKFSPIPGIAVLPEIILPDSSEQSSLNYRSSLHSGELNFVRDNCSPVWRPYCGVRYVKFDDEINHTIDQQVPTPPLPTTPSVFTVEQDRFNIFDIENNLIGFQVGLRHDLWRPMRRLTLEGFVNAGVYYNKIKYTNLMGTFTTQEFSDDPLTAGNEARTDFSDVANNDVSELSEISYIGEASVSGVCRLNKCWALRAGYQALWITDLHLAEDAFLDTGIESRDMFFHGWHAGVEHRR
jgi:hypothetical protein